MGTDNSSRNVDNAGVQTLQSFKLYFESGSIVSATCNVDVAPKNDHSAFENPLSRLHRL